MSKARSKQLRQELSDELRSLARLLEEESVVKDAGQLKQAGDNCRIYPDGRNYYWAYELNKLIIGPIDLRLNRYRHSRPRNLSQISIEIDVKLEGECMVEDTIKNPFTLLEVNLEITGETQAGDLLSCAWHLDRQPDANIDDDGEGESPLFAHPCYHFHYGGRKLWDKLDGDFGTNLLLEYPRLAHPPLDAILTIDFVLSNYLPDEWRRLRQDSSIYMSLVGAAQRRYWRPYAVATTTHWKNYNFEANWDASMIWPNLSQQKI